MIGRLAVSLTIENPRLSVACGPRPDHDPGVGLYVLLGNLGRRQGARGHGGERLFQILRGRLEPAVGAPGHLGVAMAELGGQRINLRRGLQGDGVGRLLERRRLNPDLKLAAMSDRLHRLLDLEARLAECLLGLIHQAGQAHREGLARPRAVGSGWPYEPRT